MASRKLAILTKKTQKASYKSFVSPESAKFLSSRVFFFLKSEFLKKCAVLGYFGLISLELASSIPRKECTGKPR